MKNQTQGRDEMTTETTIITNEQVLRKTMSYKGNYEAWSTAHTAKTLCEHAKDAGLTYTTLDGWTGSIKQWKNFLERVDSDLEDRRYMDGKAKRARRLWDTEINDGVRDRLFDRMLQVQQGAA